MKNTFYEYYKPSEQDFKTLWENCTFVFDTNVLLNLYRYSQETADSLIKIISLLNNRVWIPHQVGYEFQDRRLSVIWEQKIAYSELEKETDAVKNKIDEIIKSNRRHPIINVIPWELKLEEIYKDIKRELDIKKSDHPDLLNNDSILNTITDLFNVKIGAGFSAEELNKIFAEGEERYSKEIPPGFRDKNKKVSKNEDLEKQRKYGDLIIWLEIIEYAKEQGKPIILITDDKKDDWWIDFHGLNMGPRSELRREFNEKTNQLFYIYKTDQFMKYAEEYLNQPLNEKVIKEVQELQKYSQEDNKENQKFYISESKSYLMLLEQREKVIKKRLMRSNYNIKKLSNEIEITINNLQNSNNDFEKEDLTNELKRFAEQETVLTNENIKLRSEFEEIRIMRNNLTGSDPR